MKTKILTLLSILTLSATMMSCDDDQTIGETELPAASRTFLSTHFSGVNVLRMEKESNSYSVYLSNRIEVEFDAAGDWIEVDGEDGISIPTGYISPQLVAYVADNYPNNAINGIEKVKGGFDVDLVQQDIDLFFDQAGNFVRVDP